ncbi:MAG: hypothetical protein ACXWQO_06980 [Bdellovibrionota bacterium]
MKKAALAIVFFLLSNSAQALVSPVYLTFNRWQALLGGDPCFKLHDVAPPGNNRELSSIRIDVCSKKKAAAWQLLKRDFSSFGVDVEFFYSGAPAAKMQVVGGSPAERAASITKAIQVALTGNRFFFRAESTACNTRPCFYPFDVTIELEPVVIQTFTDNLSDLYGNQNLVASDHLAQLIVEQVQSTRVGFTTKKLTPQI